MSFQPINTGTADRVWVIENLIRTDSGLLRNVTQTELEMAISAANGMLGIIQTALADVKANGGAVGGISVDDVLAINAYIRANPQLLSDFTAYHGDDEDGEETGFHLIQNDGSESRLFQRNAINTVLDGIFHIGFEVRDGRFVNEDGNANARLSDVADWLTYFYTDVSTTGTALDRITDTILLDPGLMAKVKADDLMNGARAADAMNGMLKVALETVAPDALANGAVTRADVIAVSEFIQANYEEEWAGEHGDDESDEETGFHLVQNDGGRLEAYGKAVVNTVADGIYHLGFGMNDTYTRLINEDGNNNALVDDIVVWMNGILFDTAVVAGTKGDDIVTGTDLAEQLQGDRGDDTILAGAGNDTIYGGKGHDELFGEAGDDLFIAMADYCRSDHYDGGAGYDVIDATAVDKLIIGGGLDTGDSIEEIIGNGTTVVHGTNGDEVLDFSGTTLTNITKIKAGSGRDRVTGTSDDDLIYGESGNDTLDGGAGNDVLNGGYGTDKFIFADNSGRDIVRGFNAKSESIMLVGHAGVNEFADLEGMMTEEFGSTTIDFGDGDVLVLEGIEMTQLNFAAFEFMA